MVAMEITTVNYSGARHIHITTIFSFAVNKHQTRYTYFAISELIWL